MFTCGTMVIEVFGISAYAMEYNAFIVTFAIMSLGFSVEFTVYFSSVFSLRSGSTEERLKDAMAQTIPATMMGAASTLISVAPLIFYPIHLVPKYACTFIGMLVGVGLVNGILFLPAYFAILDPVFSRRCCSKHEEKKPFLALVDTQAEELGNPRRES